jgi:hypothetical protein
VVTERTANPYEGRAPQISRARIDARVDSNRNANESNLPNGNSALKSASPVPTPSSLLSPAKSASYPPLTTATPAASLNSHPAVGSSAPAGSASFLKSRVVQWVLANRLATLLGALILLSLILYLVFGLRGRGKDVSKAKRKKSLKVQPKVQPNVEPNVEPSVDPAHFPDAEMNEVAGVAAGVSPRSPDQPSELDKQPGVATSVAATTTSNHSWGLTKPSLVSPSAGHDAPITEEEEREVFEL